MTTDHDGHLFGYGQIKSRPGDRELQASVFRDLGIVDRDMYLEREPTKALTSPPELGRLFADIEQHVIRPGDSVACWKLDRLGNDPGQVIKFIYSLAREGIFVRSFDEGVDTRRPDELNHVLSVLSQMETNIQRLSLAFESREKAGSLIEEHSGDLHVYVAAGRSFDRYWKESSLPNEFRALIQSMWDDLQEEMGS